MKDLEVKISVRNNRLKQRREELGLTQADLCRILDLHPVLYSELERLKRSPRRKRPPHLWTIAALKLSEFYSVLPEDLFPEHLNLIAKDTIARKIDVPDLARLVDETEGQFQLTDGGMGDEVDRKRLQGTIEKLVDQLTPKEQMVIRARFFEERTLDSVGHELGVHRESIRQIEARAIKKLQHPSRSRHLTPFFAPETEAEKTPNPYEGAKALTKEEWAKKEREKIAANIKILPPEPSKPKIRSTRKMGRKNALYLSRAEARVLDLESTKTIHSYGLKRMPARRDMICVKGNKEAMLKLHGEFSPIMESDPRDPKTRWQRGLAKNAMVKILRVLAQLEEQEKLKKQEKCKKS